MQLIDKLSSISNDDTVSELDILLNDARVRVNWYGQRLVSVDGYAGSVEINQLAKKYLSATPFHRNSQQSFEQRLDCHALWDRVKELYNKSDQLLESNRFLKFVVYLKEFRPYCRTCAGDPLAIIGEWELSATKSSVFRFTSEEFKKIWPDSEPELASTAYIDGKPDEECYANKEMVEEALNRQKTQDNIN